MLYKDEILLEKAYHSIYEDNNPFKPASEDDIKDRKKHQIRLDNQKVQDYIKNGSVGDLDLTGAAIKSLPDDLKVGGELELAESAIQYLPDNLTVGRSLNLEESDIKELPAGLTVGVSLYIDFTSITSLPNNLTVGGSIWAQYSSLANVGMNIEVGDRINIDSAVFDEFPPHLRHKIVHRDN